MLWLSKVLCDSNGVTNSLTIPPHILVFTRCEQFATVSQQQKVVFVFHCGLQNVIYSDSRLSSEHVDREPTYFVCLCDCCVTVDYVKPLRCALSVCVILCNNKPRLCKCSSDVQATRTCLPTVRCNFEQIVSQNTRFQLLFHCGLFSQDVSDSSELITS